MGLFSCFGCGSADQEKVERKPLTEDSNRGGVDVSDEVEKPELAEDSPQKALPSSPKIKEVDSVNEERDSKPASTAPNDLPCEISKAPEESFGSNHLITDEQINRQAYNSPARASNVSLDPSVTEEDRWFES